MKVLRKLERAPASPDDPRWHGAAREHGLRDVIRWAATRKPVRWPKWVGAVTAVPPAQGEHEPEGWTLTPIGHSTVLLELGELCLLTDPIFSMRCSPSQLAGPRRVCAPGVAAGDLPRVDVVLLSHDHYDHWDTSSLRQLEAEHQPLFVTGVGNARRLRWVPRERVVELAWWHGVEIGPEGAADGTRVTFVPAQHFSGRGAFDRNRSLWGGFVIESTSGSLAHPRRSLYVAGDTGFSDPLFTTLRQTFGTFDACLLPIGAYEPRWFMGPVHMDPEEAVRAHLALGSGFSLGVHYGTFQLTDEGRDEPRTELLAALREHGVSPGAFEAPVHFGERLFVPGPA